MSNGNNIKTLYFVTIFISQLFTGLIINQAFTKSPDNLDGNLNFFTSFCRLITFCVRVNVFDYP